MRLTGLSHAAALALPLMMPGLASADTLAHALPVAEQLKIHVSPDASVTAAGTITLTLTVHLSSSFGTDIKVDCGLALSPSDPKTFSEIAFESADRIVSASGTTVTCKLPIPYSWTVTSLADVSVSPTVTVTASGSAYTRSSTHALPDFVLQGNTNKALTASVTL